MTFLTKWIILYLFHSCSDILTIQLLAFSASTLGEMSWTFQSLIRSCLPKGKQQPGGYFPSWTWRGKVSCSEINLETGANREKMAALETWLTTKAFQIFLGTQHPLHHFSVVQEPGMSPAKTPAQIIKNTFDFTSQEMHQAKRLLSNYKACPALKM